MTNIYPGDLIQLKPGLLQHGESFKVGRAALRSGDILRCIGSSDNRVLLFVSRRTNARFPFAMNTLAAKFDAIGFDGLEAIGGVA